MKKIICILLSAIVIFSFSFSVSALKIDDVEIEMGDIFRTPAVYFDDAQVTAGGTVTVDLMVKNNPGFTELEITFACDSGLSVRSVADGTLGTAEYSGGVLTVASQNEISSDGCIAKVTFDANTAGEKAVNITVSATNGAGAVSVKGSVCTVTVEGSAAGLPGDVDESGSLDIGDLAKMKLALADGTEDTLVNGDLNNDGGIDIGDLSELKLLLAGQ